MVVWGLGGSVLDLGGKGFGFGCGVFADVVLGFGWDRLGLGLWFDVLCVSAR